MSTPGRSTAMTSSAMSCTAIQRIAGCGRPTPETSRLRRASRIYSEAYRLRLIDALASTCRGCNNCSAKVGSRRSRSDYIDAHPSLFPLDTLVRRSTCAACWSVRTLHSHGSPSSRTGNGPLRRRSMPPTPSHHRRRGRHDSARCLAVAPPRIRSFAAAPADAHKRTRVVQGADRRTAGARTGRAASRNSRGSSGGRR